MKAQLHALLLALNATHFSKAAVGFVGLAVYHLCAGEYAEAWRSLLMALTALGLHVTTATTPLPPTSPSPSLTKEPTTKP